MRTTVTWITSGVLLAGLLSGSTSTHGGLDTTGLEPPGHFQSLAFDCGGQAGSDDVFTLQCESNASN